MPLNFSCFPFPGVPRNRRPKKRKPPPGNAAAKNTGDTAEDEGGEPAPKAAKETSELPPIEMRVSDSDDEDFEGN